MSWVPGSPVRIETARYRLQSLEPGHIGPDYVRWWSDPKVMAQLPSPLVKHNLEQHRARIAMKFNNRNSFHLGIYDKTDNQLVGFFTILYKPFHGIATINTVIGDKDAWGKGVFNETGIRLQDFMFGVLGAAKIECEVSARNFSTVYNLKAQGFAAEGSLRKHWAGPDGKRIDVIPFGILREEWLARKGGETS